MAGDPFGPFYYFLTIKDPIHSPFLSQFPTMAKRRSCTSDSDNDDDDDTTSRSQSTTIDVDDDEPPRKKSKDEDLALNITAFNKRYKVSTRTNEEVLGERFRICPNKHSLTIR